MRSPNTTPATWFAFGVTTIRNPGGDLEAAARYKARLEAGDLIGPESFNAGPGAQQRRHARPSATAVQSVDEVQAAVARPGFRPGADWIKLYTGLSPELLRAGIDAAHAHDRPAVAHLEEVSWPDALAMGLDGLVHLMPISPDLLDPAGLEAWRARRPARHLRILSNGGSISTPMVRQPMNWWPRFDRHRPGSLTPP